MMTRKELADLLNAAEKAHAASGHSAKHWADWYAQYMLPHLADHMEQANEIRSKRAWG